MRGAVLDRVRRDQEARARSRDHRRVRRRRKHRRRVRAGRSTRCVRIRVQRDRLSRPRPNRRDVGDPNVLAALLVCGPDPWACPRRDLQRRSPAILVLALFASVLCAAGIVLTGSRGGLVALAAGLVAGGRSYAGPRRRVPVAVVALLITGSVAFYYTNIAPDAARDRISTADGGSGRTDIWKIATRMIEDKPARRCWLWQLPGRLDPLSPGRAGGDRKRHLHRRSARGRPQHVPSGAGGAGGGRPGALPRHRRLVDLVLRPCRPSFQPIRRPDNGGPLARDRRVARRPPGR